METLVVLLGVSSGVLGIVLIILTLRENRSGCINNLIDRFSDALFVIGTILVLLSLLLSGNTPVQKYECVEIDQQGGAYACQERN